MKVIVAGMPKTGTKSMAAALRELGYVVYDYLENYEYLGQNWTQLLTKGGSIEDFRSMFRDVDVVCDVPACYFWEEIHNAFPDAKRAPKDKLLVYNVKEGWAPLCEFLGVANPPTIAFPHENVKGNYANELLTENLLFKRMKRESEFGLFAIASLVACAICRYYKHCEPL